MSEATPPWPGLFRREGDQIVPAAPGDQEVARSYCEFPDKGPIFEGQRITILTRSVRQPFDQPVRIIHVCEAISASVCLFVMGPKPVYGEYVDDVLVTQPTPTDEDPLRPSAYDGRVLTGPAVDYNFDITSYIFDKVGTHIIQWRPIGGLASNILRIEITSSVKL